MTYRGSYFAMEIRNGEEYPKCSFGLYSDASEYCQKLSNINPDVSYRVVYESYVILDLATKDRIRKYIDGMRSPSLQMRNARHFATYGLRFRDWDALSRIVKDS